MEEQIESSQDNQAEPRKTDLLLSVVLASILLSVLNVVALLSIVWWLFTGPHLSGHQFSGHLTITHSVNPPGKLTRPGLLGSDTNNTNSLNTNFVGNIVLDK